MFLGCSYDGGDCCDKNADHSTCIECLCLEDHGSCPGAALIGDGNCDPFNMKPECLFDGGDCGGPDCGQLHDPILGNH